MDFISLYSGVRVGVMGCYLGLRHVSAGFGTVASLVAMEISGMHQSREVAMVECLLTYFAGLDRNRTRSS